MARRNTTRLTPREGRKFALTVGTAFLVLTGVLLWREHERFATALGVIGGTLLLAGLVIPGRLGPVRHGWMAMAHAISRVTTPIFLGIVFYLVLTPIGVIRRITGGNPMFHKVEDGGYWLPRDAAHRRSDLRRQF